MQAFDAAIEATTIEAIATTTSTSINAATSEWQTLVNHSDYEICSNEPYQIRKKDNERIVSESVDGAGYIQLHLGDNTYLKHRLIADHFIPNPDPERFTVVDHVNHIRTDNRLINLRWVSQRRNSNNRSDQRFTWELPKEAIVVDTYNGWSFEDLYYHNNTFYVYNGINYVVKPSYLRHGKYYSTQATDTVGIKRDISYIKFKKQYGLN